MFGLLKAMGARPSGERLRRMQASPQWKDGRFSNPLPERMNLWRVFRRWLRRSKYTVPLEAVPVKPLDPALFQTPPESGLRITWLGHSSALIEIDGMKVLVDPVWGQRASPFAGFGPSRFFAPPLALAKLPLPDLVLFTHDHYDHLDEPTVRAMKDWDTVFAMPLGLGAHVAAWGVPEARILEKDWGEEGTLKGLSFACTQARHFSGRGIFDRRGTLWCGWALLGARHRVYISGDGALFEGLESIGTRYGPFDAALMEIGSYDPSWPDVHMGPEQAVEAFKLLRGGLFVPVHWATFNLGTHGWTEPIERLILAAQAAGVPFVAPMPGESIEPSAPPPLRPWWPKLPWQSAQEAAIVSTGLGR